MRILMISALEVWALSGQGGAPSLYNTLAGYAQRGHKVDYVSATIGANHECAFAFERKHVCHYAVSLYKPRIALWLRRSSFQIKQSRLKLN